MNQNLPPVFAPSTKEKLDQFDLELLHSNILGVKEKTFIHHYLRTGNKSEAGRLSGMNPHATLDRPKIKAALEYLMDKKGLTDGKILDVAIDGLKAVKRNEDGSESKDYLVRRQYLRDLMEIKEMFGSKDRTPMVAIQNNFNISSADGEVLKTIAEKLSSLNKDLELNGDENVIEAQGVSVDNADERPIS